MKNRVFRLVREYGMLRTPYVPYSPERIDFGLCNKELEEYFDVPRDCEEAYLVLSTKEHKDSYGVHMSEPDHLQVVDPNKTVWVDDALALVVDLFAKAAKQDVVYLSIEL